MAAALRDTVVLGVTTNHARLRAIVDHPVFRGGRLHTGFVDEHLPAPSAPCPPAEAVAAAVAALNGQATGRDGGPSAPDPWSTPGGWRLGPAP
jgi:acetyl/propionyl-CoA carboxylase alpha subunit